MSDDSPLLCHRCGVELTPGEGDWYIVKIEAIADPTPSDLAAEPGELEIRREITRLLKQMRDMSERELMDQVHRKMTIHLCGPCYQQWIENPTG